MNGNHFLLISVTSVHVLVTDQLKKLNSIFFTV